MDRCVDLLESWFIDGLINWLVSIEQYFSYVQGENKLRII